MLHMRYKNNGLQYFIQLAGIRLSFSSHNPFIILLRHPQAQYSLQLIYSTCHSTAAKNQYIIAVCINMFLNNNLSLFISLGHQCSCNSSFCMCISHKRHYLFLNTFFNGLVSSAACSPVCIDNFFFSKRRFKNLLMADDVSSECREIIFQCTFLYVHGISSIFNAVRFVK